MWRRYRFQTHRTDDCKPLIFNPIYPWWRTAGSGDGKSSTIVAYLHDTENLLHYWDDAYDITFTEHNEIEFTGRFPKPEYYIGSEYRIYLTQEEHGEYLSKLANSPWKKHFAIHNDLGKAPTPENQEKIKEIWKQFHEEADKIEVLPHELNQYRLSENQIKAINQYFSYSELTQGVLKLHMYCEPDQVYLVFRRLEMSEVVYFAYNGYAYNPENFMIAEYVENDVSLYLHETRESFQKMLQSVEDFYKTQE